MTRFTVLSSLLVLALAGCSDDDGDPMDPPEMPGPGSDDEDDDVVELPEEIAANRTLTADKTYILPRNTKVVVKTDVTLTIAPGTKILGEKGSVLVIARGAKILAEGTAAAPIVFTSSQAEGSRTAGWWGGVLILGRAQNNVNALPEPRVENALFEAFTNSEASFGTFGGLADDDDSGILKYVRIEFGGFNFVADREFNNLTLCSVGNKTVIDFVQVHGGSDDGIELFGGTVNVKHLVSSQNQDDGFDTDNGWHGKAQFVIIQDVAHPLGLGEASNGYESDNHATATSWRGATPRTKPTMSNVTLIGDRTYAANRNFAAVFRRGTAGTYMNHVWYGFATGPEFRDQETLETLTSGDLSITSSLFFANGAANATGTGQLPQTATAPLDIVELDWLNDVGATRNNKFDVDPGFSANITNRPTPAFKPAAAITANAATPPNDGFFDTNAKFVGAIGTEDWTAGWTAYPQN